MKADLPRPLRIPAWVPKPVAQAARAEYAREVHQTYARAIKEFGPPEDHADCDMLAELDEVRVNYAENVCDDLAEIAKDYQVVVSNPRMRSVWHELSRRHNGGFLHPARAPSTQDAATVELFERAIACGLLHPARAPSTQEAALIEVFEVALECRKWHWTTTTRGEVERRRRRFLAKAEELEHDAISMMVHSLPCRGMDFGDESFEQKLELRQKLMHAADACKEYARMLDAAKPFTLKREHDSPARQLALTISDKFRELFGQPMYGLTATITSVVLGRPINSRQTEQWCASHPPIKAPKISS
jgi:hypothetical protein